MISIVGMFYWVSFSAVFVLSVVSKYACHHNLVDRYGADFSFRSGYVIDIGLISYPHLKKSREQLLLEMYFVSSVSAQMGSIACTVVLFEAIAVRDAISFGSWHIVATVPLAAALMWHLRDHTKISCCIIVAWCAYFAADSHVGIEAMIRPMVLDLVERRTESAYTHAELVDRIVMIGPQIGILWTCLNMLPVFPFSMGRISAKALLVYDLKRTCRVYVFVTTLATLSASLFPLVWVVYAKTH